MFLLGPTFLTARSRVFDTSRCWEKHVTIFTVITSPWMVIGQAINLMIILFVADASVTAWRRGERRKALIVGGGVEFFLCSGYSRVR